METILVTQGEGWCLLGTSAAKRLQVLRVGPELGNVAKVFPVSSGIDGIVDRFPAEFSGVGKSSGYQLKLHIDPEVRPVSQKPRRIPYPLKEKSLGISMSSLILTSLRRFQVQQRGSAQLCSPPSQTKMMFASCGCEVC